MPLGLGYIAAVLENAGHDVSLVDAYVKNLSYDALAQIVKTSRPDVIGITCLSDQRTSWFKLIELIRATDSKIKIVLGGPHPSLMTEQVLGNFKPDAVVIGEGEETMLDFRRIWEEDCVIR